MDNPEHCQPWAQKIEGAHKKQDEDKQNKKHNT